MIAAQFNGKPTTPMRTARLRAGATDPVMATPAMLGIIAVAAVTCAIGGAAAYSATR